MRIPKYQIDTLAKSQSASTAVPKCQTGTLEMCLYQKLSLARNSPEARKKRSESLKAWAEENPEEAKANAKKRSAASVAKCSKPVNMCDLETGEVIRTFTSQHEAAQWLVDNGLAKNTNCVSSINGVCQRKPCTTGYGYRKKAHGYDWQYAGKEPETSN